MGVRKEDGRSEREREAGGRRVGGEYIYQGPGRSQLPYKDRSATEFFPICPFPPTEKFYPVFTLIIKHVAKF
jgi:hypothetical protein